MGYIVHMKYEIGKTYDATRGGKSPIDATKNPGIALAPLTWVLKEWMAMGANPNWHLFMVEFNAGDVVSDSNSKFTVSKDEDTQRDRPNEVCKSIRRW